MFGFNKKKEKKQGHLDKILMGVVVGGAIGSVLGVSLAPKKGSETRKDITKHTETVFKKAGKSIFGVIGKMFRRKHLHQGHSSETSAKSSSTRPGTK